MKIKRNVILIAILIFVFANSIPCYANKGTYNFQLDRTITNNTTKFMVLYDDGASPSSTAWKGASLYVTSSSGKVLYRSKCTGGSMDVVIPKQKKGTVLKIYLKSSAGISNVKKVTVKDLYSILSPNYSAKIKKPVVSLRSGYGTYSISARKGDTVIIRSNKKVLKKIYFTSTGTKQVHNIEKYLKQSELYIYTVRGKYRSKGYTILPRTYFIYE